MMIRCGPEKHGNVANVDALFPRNLERARKECCARCALATEGDSVKYGSCLVLDLDASDGDRLGVTLNFGIKADKLQLFS